MYWEQQILLVGETACDSGQIEWKGKHLTTHNNQPVSNKHRSSTSSSQPTTIRPSTVSRLLALMNQNTNLILNLSMAKLSHTRQLQRTSHTSKVLRLASTASPTSSYLDRSPMYWQQMIWRNQATWEHNYNTSGAAAAYNPSGRLLCISIFNQQCGCQVAANWPPDQSTPYNYSHQPYPHSNHCCSQYVSLQTKLSQKSNSRPV